VGYLYNKEVEGIRSCPKFDTLEEQMKLDRLHIFSTLHMFGTLEVNLW
jgi:hypothetical protein